MRELALFAGAGGGILGGRLLGWRTVCAVELDRYAASILVARQNDGTLPPFPVWDDVQTFDGRPWRGRVDVVSGGFPCQDISIAGKGAGIDGERSGLWREMARIVGEVRPRFVLVENSPRLVRLGLARVLSDLASMGYDARWGVVGAHHVGAPHQRDRLWIVGYAVRFGCDEGREDNREDVGAQLGSTDQHTASMSNAHGLRKPQPQGTNQEQWGRSLNLGKEGPHANSLCSQGEQSRISDQEIREKSSQRPLGSSCDVLGWWAAEPNVGRMAHGVASRVDRIKALGNGQVPSVAALAWKILNEN